MDLIGIIVIVVVLIGFIFYSYNRIIKAKQNVNEAWSDIDVQLKRRHDLIPNLVETVKGYATYEKDLFEKLASERSKALTLGSENVVEKEKVESDIEKTLHSIFALAENYPQLKANENFIKLQDELANTEDQLASSRRIYNSNVADYNSVIATVPTNIIALFLKATPAQFFENDEKEPIQSETTEDLKGGEEQ